VWKELIRLLCVEGQPIKAVLPQTCMGVFFIHSVSHTIFAMFFFQNRLRAAADQLTLFSGHKLDTICVQLCC
jgi:hypothetical protein